MAAPRMLLLWLLPLACGAPAVDNSTVLVVAGGNGAGTSVEVCPLLLPPQAWSTSPPSCSGLPPFPRDMFAGVSLDLVGKELVACWEDGCLVLGPEGWEEGPATLHSRTFHTTLVAGTTLHLLGGNQSPGTSEVVDLATGAVREGFPLRPARGGHCSIPVAADTVVLTGGWQAEALVTELSGLAGEEVMVRQLPSLLVNRCDPGWWWWWWRWWWWSSSWWSL